MQSPDPIKPLGSAGAPYESSKVTQSPSEGSRLTQWTSRIGSFFGYIRNIGRLFFSYPTYSQEKMELAHQLADVKQKGAFQQIVQALASKSKEEIEEIKTALQNPRIQAAVMKGNARQKTELIKHSDLFSVMKRMDSLSPLPEKLIEVSFSNMEEEPGMPSYIKAMKDFLDMFEAIKKETPYMSPTHPKRKALSKFIIDMGSTQQLAPFFKFFYVLQQTTLISNPQPLISHQIDALFKPVTRGALFNFTRHATLPAVEAITAHNKGNVYKPKDLVLEDLCQCNFPIALKQRDEKANLENPAEKSRLENPDKEINTATTPFEIIITHPKTGETRPASLFLPSPPCEGVMRTRDIEKVLRLLNEYFLDNSVNYKQTKESIAKYLEESQQQVTKEKVDAIFTECKNFCDGVLEKGVTTLVALEQGKYVDPLMELTRLELTRPSADLRQVFENSSTKTLFRLPETGERSVNFSLLPPATDPSFQKYATISKEMVDEAAQRITSGKQEKEILFAITPDKDPKKIKQEVLHIERNIRKTSLGEVLELSFSIGKEDAYSYKKNYQLLLLTNKEVEDIKKLYGEDEAAQKIQEKRLQNTIDHIQKGEFLQRDLLEALASFRGQAMKEKAYEDYQKVVEPAALLQQPREEQLQAMIEAMKAGKVVNGSLLPPDPDNLLETPQLQEFPRLQLENFAEKLQKNLETSNLEIGNRETGNLTSTTIQLPYAQGDKIKNRDIPVTFLTSERMINGERALLIHAMVIHEGHTYSFPLQYKFEAEDQTSAALIASLNEKNLVRDDLLRMLAYFMTKV